MFVAEEGIASSKIVKLGNVIGGFVEINEGLTEGDQVILDRNVISGDPVKIIN